MSGEFDMIARYFRPLTMGRDDLCDDCAVLAIPAGRELLVTTDTLNAGVHFPEDAHPADIARKALRVSLSDLFSGGGVPLAYQLALAFPHEPEVAWLEAFCGALLSENKAFNVYCSGGDTTSTRAAFSVTVTAMGSVQAGKSVRRGGAQAGDAAIVTGVIGRGYEVYSRGGVYVPDLRLVMADIVSAYAHAAVDVSDGLLADVGHIARASGLDLRVAMADIPVVGEPLSAVAGGDDYEIVMAVAADRVDACLRACRDAGMDNAACIGAFLAGSGVVDLLDRDGRIIPVTNRGWVHF